MPRPRQKHFGHGPKLSSILLSALLSGAVSASSPPYFDYSPPQVPIVPPRVPLDTAEPPSEMHEFVSRTWQFDCSGELALTIAPSLCAISSTEAPMNIPTFTRG